MTKDVGLDGLDGRRVLLLFGDDGVIKHSNTR